jgi:methylthioribose-1-phosphate isomerase
MVKEQGATLQAIRYAPGSLELLDQRLLPTQSVFLPVPTTAVAFDHIKDMVRYRC